MLGRCIDRKLQACAPCMARSPLTLGSKSASRRSFFNLWCGPLPVGRLPRPSGLRPDDRVYMARALATPAPQPFAKNVCWMRT